MIQRWPTVLVLALVLTLGLGAAWAIRAGSGVGGTPVAPASATPHNICGGYTPTPDSEMAATQHSYTQLLSRYRQYQKYWHAYQKELMNCQQASPPDCASKDTQGDCGDQRLTQCLARVRAPLEMARNGVHDQAIALEWAAQQLAGKTE